MDAKRLTPRYIIIKRPKVKERLLKATEVSYWNIARWEEENG